MEKRTLGYLLTIASTLLCGLPGLAVFCVGSLGALGVMIDTEPSSGDTAYAIGGVVFLFCVGIVLMLIPVAAGLWTRRSLSSPVVSDAGLDIGPLPDDF